MHSRVVLSLRSAGYDVESILETMPGKLDEEILARRDIGDLVFITGDKGFGRWLFQRGLPKPLTVLFSRLPHREWDVTAKRLLTILERGVPPGQMVTITKRGERTKPFSTGASND